MVRRIDSDTATQVTNPYRQILRRHVPEPLLALLIFVLGVWVWDHHFGATEGYEEGTCRMALLKIDRDLRLEEATDDLPIWLRHALAIEDRAAALKTAVDALEALGKEAGLDDEGAYALAILDPIRRGENPAAGPFARLGLPGPPDLSAMIQRIAAGTDLWWEREYLKRTGRVTPSELALHAGTEEEDPRNRELALRAIGARGAVWLLVLAGLSSVPAAFRGYGRALGAKATGYIGNWSPALGLCVFLLAYLASIGFGMTLNQAISMISRGQAEGVEPELAVPPLIYALLDASTRFLPALVALGFLFRKGRHAASRMGLLAKPEFPLVLGTFALLTVVDQLLKHALTGRIAPDPSGGLSMMEAGPWGLVLAVTSACIAAPIAEEILFRGVLFRSLANRLRVPAATLVSAAIFAVVHFYNAYGLLSVGVFGVACALCFAASGRLATAIVLHALYNSAIKIPEWIVYHAPL